MLLGSDDIGLTDLVGCPQERVPSSEALSSRLGSSEFTEDNIVHRDLIGGLWVLLQEYGVW
jgi:hypothetical protein